MSSDYIKKLYHSTKRFSDSRFKGSMIAMSGISKEKETLLNKTLKNKINIDPDYMLAYIKKEWQSIGGIFIENSKPVGIKGQSLLIETSKASFAQELTFILPAFIEKISKKYDINLKEFKLIIRDRN